MTTGTGYVRAARVWHGGTAAVGAFALVAQLVLVASGASVLVPEAAPGTAVRLWRLVSYFTIDCNVLVLVSALTLVARPARDGDGWRVLRLTALVGIVVTGLVHWFFLRPLLHLAGWSYLCDKLLHVVVPLLALVGWLLFGPRRRVTWRVALYALIFPVAWAVYTIVAGAATKWYPYPFLDVVSHGYPTVLVNIAAITVLFLALSTVFWAADRSLPPVPDQPGPLALDSSTEPEPVDELTAEDLAAEHLAGNDVAVDIVEPAPETPRPAS